MKKNKTKYPEKWRIKELLICNLIVVFLIGSFFYPFTHEIWIQINETFFRVTNHSFQGGFYWQLFWALANHRVADWIEDIVFVTLFINYIRKAPVFLRTQKIAEFLFTILFCSSIIYFVISLLFRTYLQIPQPSPTLVLEPCFRLSQAIPWFKVKDTALRSFPGDHAVTAFLLGGCVLFYMRKKVALWASVYALFLTLPRLMAGAHWFSDVFMGSLSIALFCLSWAFFTPFHEVCVKKIVKFLDRIKKMKERALKKARYYKKIR
jgi:membrane-associated phospholipid phosphatase